MTKSTSNILLIRPANFGINPETSGTNHFQKKMPFYTPNQIKKMAVEEFDNAINILIDKGINVFVFDDTNFPIKPDAVFPNNWITFHNDGTVILYPMLTPNRMSERRLDIVDSLKTRFNVTRIIDMYTSDIIRDKLSSENNLSLEGTGSIVFDHTNNLAFACISKRTDKELLLRLCNYINYEPIYFNAVDKKGNEIYHTNVMMCIAEKFCVICLDSIKNVNERNFLLEKLMKTGHEIIDISFEQMNKFAGNMLFLQSRSGPVMVLSVSSFNSLNSSQKNCISRYCELVSLNLNVIETIGGGSARCMIAEIFLPELII